MYYLGCCFQIFSPNRNRVSPAWDPPGHSPRMVAGGVESMSKVNGLQRNFKVLLLFPRDDGVCQAWKVALTKHNHMHTHTRTLNDAKTHMKRTRHDLVVVDARTPRGVNDPILVCGSLKEVVCGGGTVSPNNFVFVAVVKRSFAERDRATVGPMLKAGFDRILVESSNVGVVLNELIQIEQSETSGQAQRLATNCVLSTLDSCRELVHITDSNHRIKYINKACENILGYTLEDIAERSFWELHTAEISRQQGGGQNQPPASAKEDAKPNVDMGEAMSQFLMQGRGEWEGVMACRRRSGGTLHLPSKIIHVPTTAVTANVIPVNSSSSSLGSNCLVYLMDTHLLDRLEMTSGGNSAVESFHPRGSIKSLRKGSHDIRSLDDSTKSSHTPRERDRFTFSRSTEKRGHPGMIRRQSLVKLHNAASLITIEAPISRVFSIISAAQENSPAYVAQALEKALEILRSTELYAPQLVSAQSPSTDGPGGGIVAPGSGVSRGGSLLIPSDPVATDLLGGLLAQGPKPLMSGRRSSNDTAVKPTQQLSRPSLPALQQQASAAIRDLLAEDLNWDFDIFKLEKISDKRPLVWLGMSLMCQFEVPSTLGCDESTLQNWLTLIEANYHCDNTYHNSTHAADVLQSTAYFLSKERIAELFDPLDIAACLVAAVVHDVDHPGKNSAFLCNTNNEIAILYNDLSVLESHHVAVSFKHTRSDDRVNIFKALDRDTYKHLRKSIIDMVLATDMTKHFEHLSKFVNMAANNTTTTTATATTAAATGGEDVVFDDDLTASEDDRGDSSVDLLSFNTPENLIIIKRMLIKCADVSNPLRPLQLSIDWAYRIANEYFNQTEEEKKLDLPIVMPQFDRTTCSIPKSQIGFIDFFINDMFDSWDALADIPELLDHLRANYIYWKEQEEREAAHPPPQQAPPPPQPSPPPPPQPQISPDKEITEEEEEGEEDEVLNLTAAAS